MDKDSYIWYEKPREMGQTRSNMAAAIILTKKTNPPCV
jgi:hypothetical protein